MTEKGAGEDLYSRDELEKDVKRVGGGRRATWFLIGLVVGVAGALLLPPLLAPYVPDAIRPGREQLTGPVVAEERDGDRLLLTVDAGPGAFIASFDRRVSEIALLVVPGDTVTLAVTDYEPFVENPDIEGVRKARPASAAGTRGAEAAAGRAVAGDSATRAGADTIPGVAPDSVPGSDIDTSGGAGAAASDSSGGASTTP
ncbi:MAG: hypothetical protein ACRELC_02335 [Gemmatimonadota bacterium]